ncbi:hypothetical protein RKD20_005413 [Streptomyces sp. SLBN-8D4]
MSRPVGEDDVQSEDVLRRDPVLHTAQSAGRGADVAADRAHLPAGGVRRVVEAEFVHRAGEGRVDDAGFDDGDAVDRADLQDPVHLRQGQHDAAVGGVGRARQARAGALGDDRDAQFGGDAHDVLDLFDRARQDDHGGGAGRAEARHVVGVGARDVRVGEHGVGGQSAEQAVHQVAGDLCVFIATGFDTAHDHSVAPGAIGVNPTSGSRRMPECGRRAGAQ